MSKLHTEKRIKGVDTTVAENNASNFEDGDVVYASDGGGGFKVKSGPVGGGSFNPLPAGDLGGLGDVDLTGLSAADIGDQLTYSYLDATKTVTWRTGTTITISMNKAGKRGVDGNVVAITFVVDAGTPAGAASYSAAGNGTLQITYADNVTTATQIKTAIDGVSDFTATITGTASHTANNGDGGLGNTTFSGGFTGWMSDSPGTGVAPTNLTYDAGTRTIASSTGVDAVLPNATAGGDSGLMTGADKTKLNNIETAADVTDTTNVTAAGALMDSECTSLTDVKALDQSVVSGADPTFGTANMTDSSNKRFVTDAQRGYLVPMGSGNSYAQGLVLAGNATHGNQFLRKDGTWQVVSSDFTGLTDTPSSYAGSSADANKFVKVNGSGDGIVFQNVTIPSGNQIIDWTASQTGDIHPDNYINTEYTVGNGGLTTNDFTNTLKSKLDNIEANATADQTAAEIRALVESASDSNVFTDADHTKLNNIENNATADQTAAEIRALVESATNSNVFTDADHNKLNGIATGAQVNVATNLSYNAASRTMSSSTGTNATINEANGSQPGLMKSSDFNKLAGIAANAQVNVGTNLTYTSATRTVNSSTGNNVQLPNVIAGGNSGLMTGADKTKLNGIATGAEVNVQADWNQNNTGHDAYINNKPTILDTSGTPTADQLAVWNNSTRLEGDDNLTWNSTTKEFKVGFDADDYHIFKRTNSNLEISSNNGVHSHLLVNETGSSVARAGTTALYTGSKTGTNEISGRFLAKKATAAGTHAGVTPFSYRYHELNNVGEVLLVNVHSAISTQTYVDVYFQLQCFGLEDTDDLQIQLRKTDDVGITFNMTLWKDQGASYVQRASSTGTSFLAVYPSKNSGTGSLDMDDNETNWFKLRIAEAGGSDLDDLGYIRFLNSASAAGEDIRIANFHLAEGDQVNDESISISEGGFLELHRTMNQSFLQEIYKGGLLYVNDHGGLGFKSQYQNVDLTQKDFSWCGGITSYNSSDERFIPVNSTAEAAPPESSYHYKLMMRDGIFKKLILKTGANMGDTTIRLYKNDSLQATIANLTWVYDGSINNLFDHKLTAEFFSYNHFSEGDAISISIDTSTVISTSYDDVIFATEIWYTS